MFKFLRRKPSAHPAPRIEPTFELETPKAPVTPVRERVRYPDVPTVPGMSDPALASLAMPDRHGNLTLKKYSLPELIKGVLPEGMAAGMDSAGSPFPNIDVMSQMSNVSALGFLGYNYLAQLSQVPEYNLISTVFADELIGSWITAEPSIDGEESDTKQAIVELYEELERFQVKYNLYYLVYQDGIFGKGTIHPYIESETTQLDELRETPLVLGSSNVKKGSLKYFKTVDPNWLSPQNVNTFDPLKWDFFKPLMWWILGKRVHDSRLRTLIMNPVPDVLKPYYQYGGLSRTQLCMPGTNRAIRTLENVTAMVEKYSIVALKTDITGMTQNDQGMDRITWFNKVRNNMSLLLIDSANGEELVMANATLSGLKELAEQAVKFMAMYARIPNTKLLQDEVGSDNKLAGSKTAPQIDQWEQFVQIQRKNHLTPILQWMVELIMLNKWGRIRKDIAIKWRPVGELDAEGKAELSLIKAQIAQIMSGIGSVSADEVRQRASKDEDSQFAGLTGKAPGKPVAEGADKPAAANKSD